MILYALLRCSPSTNMGDVPQNNDEEEVSLFTDPFHTVPSSKESGQAWQTFTIVRSMENRAKHSHASMRAPRTHTPILMSAITHALWVSMIAWGHGTKTVTSTSPNHVANARPPAQSRITACLLGTAHFSMLHLPGPLLGLAPALRSACYTSFHPSTYQHWLLAERRPRLLKALLPLCTHAPAEAAPGNGRHACSTCLAHTGG